MKMTGLPGTDDYDSGDTDGVAEPPTDEALA